MTGAGTITTQNIFMAAKTFEELLFEGALNAVRTLTLDELYQQLDHLREMNLSEDIAEFPRMVLAVVICEKQRQQSLN